MADRGAPWVVVSALLLLAGCVSGTKTAIEPEPVRLDEDSPLHLHANRTVRVEPPPPLPGGPPASGPQAVMSLTGPGLRQEEGGLRGGKGVYMFSGAASIGAASWTWSFGDGEGAPGVDTQHVFEGLGSFPVKLIVESGSGEKAQNVVLLRVATEPDPWKAIRGLLRGVPCEAQVPARGTSANIVNLAELRFDEKSGHGEIDVRGDIALVGRYRGGGFEIVDVSDPLNPILLNTVGDGGGSLDVKMTWDNFTALGGSGGVTLTDIRDPANPVVMSKAQTSQHMHFTAAIGGQNYAFVVDGATGTGVKIFRIEGPPEARRMTQIAKTLPAEGGPLGPHDIFVNYDVDLRKWILYAADGFTGWLAHDVSDPAKPLPIGGFVNPGELQYVHSIQAAKVGNRRIVVTSSEIGPNMVKVYDATVLQAPVLLGVWQKQAGGLEPQHDMNIVDGRLFVAHYGYGVFVFDLRKLSIAPIAGTLDMNPVARWDLGLGSDGPIGDIGFTGIWDVVVDDGIMYMSNTQRGMHVAAFACFEPGNPSFTSVG